MYSMNYMNFRNVNQSLEEFCVHYAMMIEELILHSHNDLSPNIEANYDDYRER